MARWVATAGVAVAATLTTGCACTSRVGVESAPVGAQIYVRGDKDVSFAPVPKALGGASGSGTMTTPDNLTFNWKVLDNLPSGGAGEKLWVKVQFPGGAETKPIEIAKCENALLKFEGADGKKQHVDVVSFSKVRSTPCL